MKHNLKKFRVLAGLTQAKLAKKVGVTQPNYQRWESGAAPVPDDKLKKLAKVLETTPEVLLRRYPPVVVSLHDDSVPESLAYYGEVAIHFRGGGAPLLLSISEQEFGSLFQDLQTNESFVTVKSLSNQTVFVKINAISDLYFSSDDHDDFGPESEAYDNHISMLVPDTRDWEIIEALEDGIGLEEFDSADVRRVQNMIMITDEQYAQLVSEGKIGPEQVDFEKAKNEKLTEKIFKLASTTTYQLSTGQRRDVYVYFEKDLYHAFHGLIDFDGVPPEDQLILLEAEGRHRTIFINKNALDYILVPTHKYEIGRTEAMAELEE
jgi:transcriptional regulator with XRE-family HTH domain